MRFAPNFTLLALGLAVATGATPAFSSGEAKDSVSESSGNKSKEDYGPLVESLGPFKDFVAASMKPTPFGLTMSEGIASVLNTLSQTFSNQVGILKLLREASAESAESGRKQLDIYQNLRQLKQKFDDGMVAPEEEAETRARMRDLIKELEKVRYKSILNGFTRGYTAGGGKAEDAEEVVAKDVGMSGMMKFMMKAIRDEFKDYL